MTTDVLAERIADAVSASLKAAIGEQVQRLVEGVMGAKSARPLVDIHAIAQFFGVSVVTVRRMVGEGMPVEWVASAMRFDVDACREWNRERGKRSVTKEKTDRKRNTDEPVRGVTLKSRSR